MGGQPDVPEGGRGGSGGKSGSSGAAGKGGTPAFSCPDPRPDDGIGWTQYVVQPGHCLIVGSSTWSGEQVCRELAPDDGTCDASCKNYLSVRVDLFDEPLHIAVMPLFGTVLELDSETDQACASTPSGVRPN
jgi:hypothetical protein